MIFQPYVIQKADDERVRAEIEPATQDELKQTVGDPQWQTDWTSDYLSDEKIKKYALKTETGELIALGAYQVVGREAYVYILYVESAPASNPTMTKKPVRKYYGIGAVMLAFGIKFSIDNGCRGDVLFEAKTDELAKHYAMDFGARPIPSRNGGPRRFMLADEEAWHLFSKYLIEEE